jgi:hypothetical protein
MGSANALSRRCQSISQRSDLTPEAQATLQLLERGVQGEITTDASSPARGVKGVDVE